MKGKHGSAHEPGTTPATPAAYPYNAPPTLPQTTYPGQTYPAQSAYAYQSPYFDPSLSQDPMGPPPQPTVDVYQGDESGGLSVSTDSLGRQEILGLGAFVGEEEKILAREGGMAERAALERREASCGFNGHQAFIRGSRRPPARVAGDGSGRGHGRRMQDLRAILEPAVASKTISRADFVTAVNTCSRSDAPDADRLAAAKKLRDFLTNKGVRVAG